MVSTADLQRLDRQHIWHPFTPMKLWAEHDPLVIVAADGMYLIDSDGNRYLDGVSSLWCNVHGHRVPEIDSAIQAQLNKVAHTTMLGLASEQPILLADRLMKLVPSGLAKIFYSDSGATATEVAFKMAAQYWFNVGKPQRCEFIGFSDAYHGDTFGAMSIGRTELFHKPYFPLLFNAHFSPTKLDALRAMLAENGPRIAGICIEPIVQGAGGMLIQPHGFLAGVRALADEFGTLLIADEVATGFGRTGRMFACEHENVSPDLMCVAKGISGGYLPLAATFATQKIFDAFLGEPWEGKTFYHGHTYTGNPLACAAAMASLDLFEKNDVVRSVSAKAVVLGEMLLRIRALKQVKEVRQKGFMVGIELQGFDPRERTGAAVCLAMRKHGVIIRPLGDVIVLMPPLAMGLADLKTIISALRVEIDRLPAQI
jgi:adenosylmethionine-8-amino-7-oxononanoate aminotransferase